MAVITDVTQDESRVLYTDMFGMSRVHVKTHEGPYDSRDVVQIYADAFRYAIDRKDGGQARGIYNQHTHFFHKQSFDDYDALIKFGVKDENLAEIADVMALQIVRLQQSPDVSDSRRQQAILNDKHQQLERPVPWWNQFLIKVLNTASNYATGTREAF